MVARGLDAHRRQFRAAQIRQAVEAATPADEIDARLDTMRWLARIAAHVWRVSAYLTPGEVPADQVSQRLETGD